MSRLRTFALCLVLSAGSAGIAETASAATANTRLVTCRSESCLLISGHRDGEASMVRINGHAVPVEGQHSWRARLPVETVRAWSAPSARTIAVSVDGATAPADLPTGLLGHCADLAELVVTAK